MATLPYPAHGDVLHTVNITPRYEGKGEAKHPIGTQFDALLLFDHCAHVKVFVQNLDPAKFPTEAVIAERNMKLDFLKVRFTDLVITYFGGDYGSIRYNGTASGAEIVQNK